MEQIVISCFRIIISCGIAFCSGIVFHEIGHLIGGFISGYHFGFIQFMGHRYLRKEGKLCVIKNKDAVGQCVMYPDTINADPVKLISGGCIMNIFLAVVGVSFAVASRNVFFEKTEIGKIIINWRIIFPVMAIINFTFGIHNLFGDSATSDGTTLTEVLNDYKNRTAYNCLMCIYNEIGHGKKLVDIDELYFDVRSVRSGLLSELTLCSCRRLMEMLGKDSYDASIEKLLKSRLKILERCKYKFVSDDAKKCLCELENMSKNECC